MIEVAAPPAAPEPEPKKPLAPTTDETGATLEAYTKKINIRIENVRRIFEQSEFTPFNSKAFKKFITDHFSEASMRYILMGIVNDGDMPGTDDRMRAAGFTVAGADPNAPAKEETPERRSAPSMELPQETGSGETPKHHPLIQQAMELGFDPTHDPDDDD
jgi:hypothetical protein